MKYGCDHNPEYPRNLGATVAKFRAMARKGLRALTYEQRCAYGEAVEKAILAKQQSEFQARIGVRNPKCHCASGTNHNTGEAIHNAIRARQLAALHAFPAQARRKRTNFEWESMYADAMAEKARARAKKAKRKAA